MLKILCKLGFHDWDTQQYIQVKRQKGKHKWHRNYHVCTRCGKKKLLTGMWTNSREGS